MRSLVLSLKYANSLLSTLARSGEAMVEFDSTFLAQRTVARMSIISSFPFSVSETEEGYFFFQKLEVIL